MNKRKRKKRDKKPIMLTICHIYDVHSGELTRYVNGKKITIAQNNNQPDQQDAQLN